LIYDLLQFYASDEQMDLLLSKAVGYNFSPQAIMISQDMDHDRLWRAWWQ